MWFSSQLIKPILPDIRIVLITASGDIGPHRSFIVPHRTTNVTKSLSKDQLFYSKYCSSSEVLIKNDQFVVQPNTYEANTQTTKYKQQNTSNVEIKS